MSTSARPRLARRLITWYTLTVAVVLVILGVVVNQRTGDLLLDELTSRLAEEAEAVRFGLEDSDSLQLDTVALGERIGDRITIIAADGTVIADSASSPDSMENHGDRPEVISALAGELGVDSRLSATVGVSFRYVALPVEDGVVYRLSVPLTDVDESLSRLRFAIVGSAMLVGLIGIGIVWAVATRISRPLADISEAVERIAGGDQDARLPAPDLAETSRLALSVANMAQQLRGRLDEVEKARAVRDDVLSALEEAVLLVGRDGAIGYSNEPARRLFGNPVEVNRIGPRPVRQAAESALLSGETERGEFTTGVPPRHFQVTAIPIDDARLAVVVARDITEAKRVAAMRSDFVADASHELKTPVAAIRAGAETILRAADDDPEAVIRFATQVDSIAIRLGRLVNDLLDLSRLESEGVDRELIRLDRIIADEIHAADDAAADGGVDLEFELEELAISVNPNDVRLAFRNLLDNAIRYTGAGGSVTVRLRAEANEASLEVADTGIGIPTRDLPRVFERFYRVDAARSRETGGTGLGLAIVKHVVERHGGAVQVESELNRGSTFTVRLPGAAGG